LSALRNAEGNGPHSFLDQDLFQKLGPLLPTAVNQKKDSSSLLSYRGENFPPHPRSENDWGLPWQNRRIFLVLVLEGSVNFLLKRPLFIGAP